jgi:hypothetical protein
MKREELLVNHTYAGKTGKTRAITRIDRYVPYQSCDDVYYLRPGDVGVSHCGIRAFLAWAVRDITPEKESKPNG